MVRGTYPVSIGRRGSPGERRRPIRPIRPRGVRFSPGARNDGRTTEPGADAGYQPSIGIRDRAARWRKSPDQPCRPVTATTEHRSIVTTLTGCAPAGFGRARRGQGPGAAGDRSPDERCARRAGPRRGPTGHQPPIRAPGEPIDRRGIPTGSSSGLDRAPAGRTARSATKASRAVGTGAGQAPTGTTAQIEQTFGIMPSTIRPRVGRRTPRMLHQLIHDAPGASAA
jgi:hypothetical protein